MSPERGGRTGTNQSERYRRRGVERTSDDDELSAECWAFLAEMGWIRIGNRVRMSILLELEKIFNL